jgi:hypothetical protein
VHDYTSGTGKTTGWARESDDDDLRESTAEDKEEASARRRHWKGKGVRPTGMEFDRHAHMESSGMVEDGGMRWTCSNDANDDGWSLVSQGRLDFDDFGSAR